MLVQLWKTLILAASMLSNNQSVRVYAALADAILMFLTTYVWTEAYNQIGFFLSYVFRVQMQRPCNQPLANIWRCMSCLIAFGAAVYCIVCLYINDVASVQAGFIVAALLGAGIIVSIITSAIVWKTTPAAATPTPSTQD